MTETQLPQLPRASDPVEQALAEAITRASIEGEWSVVAQLARELEARRQARAGVVSLEEIRARVGRDKQ